ncbi:histone-lysine N-methyltransferase SETMAR [Elysia marginata]|uniref:Histone-lysine N-methyltransferase SETMAR n=1 Tax=Elysia marginata TaxID=1093978 RepID=A0AAV4HM96_9GAST|nr:histone-lysine N-methyltransferase SETMAR [Elysia marginata]
MLPSRVYQWRKTVRYDEPKSGCPKTSTNEENTTRVDELIKCDRRMKICEIAWKLEIPKKKKHNSMTWKRPSSPVTKKFKVMATVFWYAKGAIFLDILPQGQCINATQYCSTLDLLRDAIRCKRHGLLRRGFVPQLDNVTPKSSK